MGVMARSFNEQVPVSCVGDLLETFEVAQRLADGFSVIDLGQHGVGGKAYPETCSKNGDLWIHDSTLRSRC